MARGNEPLGEIATELIFENERVKMWALIVDPGEKSDWHLHELDYMVVNLEADEVTRELGGWYALDFDSSGRNDDVSRRTYGTSCGQ